MNKRISIHRIALLIVWITSILWITSSAPPAAAQTEAVGGGATQFYRSNRLGMALQEISRYRINDHDFVLKRIREEDGAREFLLQNGKEIQRAEYEWKGDVKHGRFYDQDRLMRETVETDGRLQEERLFSRSGSERPVERRVYEWRDGELQGVKVLSSESAAENSRAGGVQNMYIRGRDGKLLQVLNSESGVTDSYSTSGSRSTEWHFAADGSSYFYYTEGATQISERYSAGTLVYRKAVRDSEESRQVDEWYPREEKRVSSVYSSAGDLLRRRSATPDAVVHSEYSYQAGELAEQQQTVNGTERRILYSAGGGEQPDEKIFENGVLRKEVQYHGADRRTEVLYRDGEAVARVEYEGEEALSRESLIGEEL